MENLETSTPYDDVCRTLTVECDDLVIPLINEIFGKDYTLEDKIIRWGNEHFIEQQGGTEEKRITDGHLEIIKKSEQTGQHFHIECESSAGDHTILIRLVEYAFQIALDTGKTEDSSLTIEFPYSAVIYLRSRETTPSRSKIVLKTPGGEVSYEIPILQIKNYSLTDIFDKKLYFLIPFYLFCLEKDFPEIEQNEEKLAKLIETYTGIITQLERLVEEGNLSEFSYLTIRDMSNKVTANLARKYKSIKERIGDIMGGKVLDYEAKQIRDAARAEGWKSGMERGMEQMIIQMLQRGNTPEEITLFSGIPLDDIKRVQEKLP